MKKRFIISILFFLSFEVFAKNSQINSDSIKAYRNSLEYFDKMEYGKALKYAEDAILFRKQESDYELKVLHNSLTAKAVVNVGNNIKDVLAILNERGEQESIDIINFYLRIKSEEFFEGDITNLTKYIKRIELYPEAYKVIGDIYKLEGEYDFAEQYYNMALENAEILDIPNQMYDILYMLAEISKLEKNYPQMEVRLLNILVYDHYYKNQALFNSMMGTIKSNRNNSLEKFFNLYRASSYYCLIAYNELIDYYLSLNENDKALKLSALSVLTGFTKIYEILKSRNPDYEYENLSTFFQELSYYSDIIEWGTQNNVWKSFNVLAKITKESGYDIFSKELLKVLAQFTPDSYWQKEAVLQLEMFD